MRKLHKKGGIADLIQIMTILLVFGVLLLIGGKFVFELDDNFQETDILDTRGKAASSQIRGMFGGSLDNGFLFLMVGLCIVALVLAMLVAVHPVFLIFYFIFLVIIIFLGGVLSNIYQEMAATEALATVAAELTFTSHILQFLPIIIGVFGFILAIVLYRTYNHSI